MKNYVSPVIFDNEELAEGVYATGSGNGCYTVTSYSHQEPQEGRKNNIFQVNGIHNATHTTDGQNLHITFSEAVKYVSSNGQLVDGDGTTTLNVRYTYHNNNNDNIGLGDLVVEAVAGADRTVNYVSAYLTCDGAGA